MTLGRGVMKLQISSQLAIFAVLELGPRPQRQRAVAEIGEKYGVSSHHLAKVMQVLTRAGLVRSLRGAGGGYQFTGNARRTTLLDVIQLFEDLGSTDADARALEVTGEGRALRQVLGEIDDITRATFGSITIATMFKLIDRRRTGGRQASRRSPLAVSRGRLGRVPTGV
jgi:Rrf2 family protein